MDNDEKKTKQNKTKNFFCQLMCPLNNPISSQCLSTCPSILSLSFFFFSNSNQTGFSNLVACDRNPANTKDIIQHELELKEKNKHKTDTQTMDSRIYLPKMICNTVYYYYRLIQTYAYNMFLSAVPLSTVLVT